VEDAGTSGVGGVGRLEQPGGLVGIHEMARCLWGRDSGILHSPIEFIIQIESGLLSWGGGWIMIPGEIDSLSMGKGYVPSGKIINEPMGKEVVYPG